MKGVLKTVLALLAIGGIAWGGWLAWTHRPGAKGEGVAFRTAPVERGELLATITATGTIEPEEVIDVGAQVAGQIRHFGADPNQSARAIDYGAQVRQGTLLAQLDDSLFKSRVEQAQAAILEVEAEIAQADANIKKAEAEMGQHEARLRQAERDLARAKSLLPRDAITPTEYDAARAAHEIALANLAVATAAVEQTKSAKLLSERARGRVEATLREATVNLSYTQIKSPVDGVIIDRRVNVGQTVVAGLNAPSLFLIAKDLKRLQVWASVNEADIGSVYAGQPVEFTVDAYPKDRFVGQVSQIRLNASMTQNVVTYTVVVATDNAAGRLLPYMTANLRFEIERRRDALLVPNAALRFKPGREMIASDAQSAHAPDEMDGKAKSGRSSDKNELGKDGPEERGPEKNGLDQAVVWTVDGKQLRPVSVQVGISDGVQTEIVCDALEPGASIVVGVRRAGPSGDTENPFAPKMFGAGKRPGGA